MGKGLVDEGNGLGGVVDADAKLAAACAAHDIGLDLFGAKVVEGLDKVEEGAHFDGAVDLGELGEETGEEGTGEEGAVACIGGVAGTEGREDGRGGSAESEGVERVFEQGVEGLDQRGREVEDVSRELGDGEHRGTSRGNETYSILEETGPGGRLAEAEEGSESGAL